MSKSCHVRKIRPNCRQDSTKTPGLPPFINLIILVLLEFIQDPPSYLCPPRVGNSGPTLTPPFINFILYFINWTFSINFIKLVFILYSGLLVLILLSSNKILFIVRCCFVFQYSCCQLVLLLLSVVTHSFNPPILFSC